MQPHQTSHFRFEREDVEPPQAGLLLPLIMFVLLLPCRSLHLLCPAEDPVRGVPTCGALGEVSLGTAVAFSTAAGQRFSERGRLRGQARPVCVRASPRHGHVPAPSSISSGECVALPVRILGEGHEARACCMGVLAACAVVETCDGRLHHLTDCALLCHDYAHWIALDWPRSSSVRHRRGRRNRFRGNRQRGLARIGDEDPVYLPGGQARRRRISHVANLARERLPRHADRLMLQVLGFPAPQEEAARRFLDHAVDDLVDNARNDAAAAILGTVLRALVIALVDPTSRGGGKGVSPSSPGVLPGRANGGRPIGREAMRSETGGAGRAAGPLALGSRARQGVERCCGESILRRVSLELAALADEGRADAFEAGLHGELERVLHANVLTLRRVAELLHPVKQTAQVKAQLQHKNLLLVAAVGTKRLRVAQHGLDEAQQLVEGVSQRAGGAQASLGEPTLPRAPLARSLAPLLGEATVCDAHDSPGGQREHQPRRRAVGGLLEVVEDVHRAHDALLHALKRFRQRREARAQAAPLALALALAALAPPPPLASPPLATRIARLPAAPARKRQQHGGDRPRPDAPPPPPPSPLPPSLLHTRRAPHATPTQPTSPPPHTHTHTHTQHRRRRPRAPAFAFEPRAVWRR